MATKKEKDELMEKVRGDIAIMVAANPEIKNEELKEVAVKLDPSIDKLDGRVFNARYVLQAKRRTNASNKPTAAKRRATGNGRKRVATPAPVAHTAPAAHSEALDVTRIHRKGVLLAFAQELIETPNKDFATVMSMVDKYAAA